LEHLKAESGGLQVEPLNSFFNPLKMLISRFCTSIEIIDNDNKGKLIVSVGANYSTKWSVIEELQKAIKILENTN